MKVDKDKVIMDHNEFITLINRNNNLSDRNDEYFEENHQLKCTLDNYKHEVKILNKKLRSEKIKFYRNRKILEDIIDNVILLNIDEDKLKKLTNLTCKNVKEEILKMYDEDIKYN